MASENQILDDIDTSKPPCEFYPEDHCGLDFYFQTYNKLYICDILSSKEHPMFPGAYMYGSHPIYKADVIGLVVSVDQNSKCFIYGIDDGTGVIECSCWKMSFSDQYCESVMQSLNSLPPQLVRKYKSIDKSDNIDGYSLGSVINIRGKINVFRNKKQIVASYHGLVNDPNMEIFRMTELPNLYRMKYDKPFQLPWKIQQHLKKTQTLGDSEIKNIKEIKCKLTRFLKTSDISSINSSLVMDLEFIKCYMEAWSVDTKITCVESILSSLEEEGLLCKHVDDFQHYEVLCKDCNLDKVILKILNEECQKERYSEKGCHYLHVLDMLHKTYQYSRVNKQCVVSCLEKLELNSDIISFTKCHFMPINHN